MNLPTTCQETDDDGCTYYYSYETRKNATVVHVVENKGKCYIASDEIKRDWLFRGHLALV